MENPVSASNDLVSKNEAEISEVRPMATCEEETTKDNKSLEVGLENPVSASNDWVSKNGVEISETRPIASGKEETIKDYKSVEDSYRELLKKTRMRNGHEDLARYLPLRRALRNKDWKQIEDFIENKPEAIKAHLSETFSSFFHTIVWHTDREAIRHMEKYLQNLDSPKSVLEQKDKIGRTSLHSAAEAGNTEAAKIFVKYSNNLPNISNGEYFPIHLAAKSGHKETVQYLLSVTTVEDSKEESISPFSKECGFRLLLFLIQANVYDVTFHLLKRHPKLGRDQNLYRGRILQMLSEKPDAFKSGSRLRYLQRLIYHCIPVHDDYNQYTHHTRKIDSSPRQSAYRDVENPSPRKSTPSEFLPKMAITLGVFSQKLQGALRNAFMRLVPFIKDMHDTKLMHMQTVEIVRMMLSDADESLWSFEESSDTLKMPTFTAIQFGIHEIVNEIDKTFIVMHHWADKDGNTVFMHAVLHRQEKVFKFLILTKPKEVFSIVNKYGNNILHMAGKLVPSSEIAGAALQMQRELQWFKLVESIVQPSVRKARNVSGKTPLEIFTKEHKELVKEGQQWMKDTASSCTVVASLIITVVFAAAFTVPGGSNGESGIPIFLREKSFIVFVISDALALFSSTTSLLMFLGILTSRYSQEDFLVSLPRTLIIGLVTLFFSIASMMVAFGATIHIVLSHPWKWVVIPIALLGCVPITLFAFLQFPLLVEMILSTYRPSLLRSLK